MQQIRDDMFSNIEQNQELGSDYSDGPSQSPVKRSGQRVRQNNLKNRVKNLNKDVVHSYERYVLANFRFRDEGPEAIAKEQQSAIESLIPGTKYYFHLFFIDLAKKKKFEDLTKEEAELYKKFESKFCESEEFIEVDTTFKVVHKLEALPNKVDENTPSQDIDAYLNVIDYIDQKINRPEFDRSITTPPYMSMQAQQDGHSSQSEEEETASKLETFDQSKFFNRQKLIEEAHKRIKSHCEHIKYKNDHKVNLHENLNGLHLREYHQVFNDIDWTLCNPEFVYGQALQMAYDRGNNDHQRLQLFEMTNEKKFFDQICEYFKRRFNFQNEAKDKKERKFHIEADFFEAMTLDQMDMINEKLKQMNIDIKQNKSYVEAYFSKQFSDELSPEYQEHLTNEEKFTSLQNMYNYAKAQDLHKGLISSLLQQMLQMSLKLDRFEEGLFKEYINRPAEVNFRLKKQEVQKKNSKQQHKLQNWNQRCLNSVQVKQFNQPAAGGFGGQGNELIPKYLKLICTKNGGTFPESYNDHFHPDYLLEIEKQVKVYLTDNGLIDLGDEISPDEYKRIQDQVIIRFKETNKEQFKVEEPVKLILELKNIQELVIKVFEFNTETYYRKTMKPLDTSIDLQGLEPKFTQVKTEMFKGVSKNKIITEEFTFDDLIGKVGTFIIEFQGNGKLSRAIIKKGSLTLIHTTTNGGHIAYIIDENRKICKSDDGKTGLLVDSKFYPTNVEKNGAIFIPFTKANESKHQQLIMITDGFSQLGQFQRDTERYNLEAYYHLNNESVIVGQKTKLFVRPKLTLNNKATSVKHLKNCAFEMKITDHDGKQINHTVKDAKMKDNEEFIFEFMVPADTKEILVSFSAQVQNLSKNKLENLSVPNYTIKFKSHRSDELLHEMYLKKVEQDYFLYCLGKNGEPFSNAKVELDMGHKDFQNSANTTMTLDKTGRVCMGPLNGITYLNAQIKLPVSGRPNRINETWYIMNEQDQWTRPSEINIIENEKVEIPINHDGVEKLSTYQLSLRKFQGQQVLQDLTNNIKIQKSRLQTYHQISLEKLEVGSYILKLNITNTDKQFITINVRQGQYWEGSFILQKNCLREYTAPSQTLRIETTRLQKAPNDPKQTKLSILLDKFTENSRVHVFATQFMANDTRSVKSLMDDYCHSSISGVKFNFAKWQNHFSDGKAVADEILYVLNRKQQAAKMGNLLDAPSLLMRKHYVRDTHTIKEELSAGEKFEHVQLQQMAPMADLMMEQNAPKMRSKQMMVQSMAPMAEHRMAKKKKKIAYKEDKEAFIDPDMDYTQDGKSVKDFQNFLKIIPLQIFNLKPGQHGLVETVVPDIENYSNLFIVACDDKSVAQRQMSIPHMLEINQKEELEKLTETASIFKKDQRQRQEMPKTQEDGSITGGLIQTRQTLTLGKNEQVHLKDITSSKYQILADLQQVRQVMALTLRGYKDKLVDDVLLNWHTFDENKKLSQFIDQTCHEMNFFLSRKDQDFFNRHVLTFIANKMEKTLVDFYLLAKYAGDEFSKQEILQSLEFQPTFNKLNVFEKCLVIEFSLNNGSQTQIAKARQLAQNMIDKVNDLKILDQETRNKQQALIFDSILDMQNDQKPDLSAMVRSDTQGEVLECGIVMDSSSDAQDCYDKDEEEEEEERCYFGGGGGGGSIAFSAARRGFGGPPPPGATSLAPLSAPPRNQMRMARAMPMQMQQNNAFGEQLMTKNNLFEMDDPFGDLYGDQNKFGLVQFEDLDATKEYRETHYQNTPYPENFQYKFQGRGPGQMEFFTDYLQNLLDNNANSTQKPFITSQFIDLNGEEMAISLGMLDLPISISTMGEYPHKFESDGQRGIVIKAGCETIIFKKEIKEGSVNLKKDVIITHKYKSVSDPKVTKDDEDEENLKFFVINHIYSCEIVVTNITPKNKKMTLLYQVPNGSLPILKSKYIDTANKVLRAFETATIKFNFYFPEPGNFDHYPTNASVDDVITAVSDVNKLDVKKKHVITKVNTFKDLMMLTKTDEEKKQKIIKLLTDDFAMTRDKNYGFKWDDIAFLTDKDVDFFLQIQKIYQAYYNQNLPLKMQHVTSILKDPKYQKERANMLEYVKVERYHNKPNTNIFSYILRPVSSPLIDVSSRELFDRRHCHLEYYPIVNTRVFSFGKQKSGGNEQAGKQDQDTKDINNQEFKETYNTYMLLMTHQDFQKEGAGSKDLKLRLVYYLLTQDRVYEAYTIFRQVSESSQNQSSLANGGQINSATDKSATVAIDYMRAYFDFQIPKDDNFKTAREIVDKYKSNSVDNYRYRQFFKKLELQLQEFDEEEKVAETSELNDKEKEAIEKEQNKKLIPNIHAVTTDDQTGTITIESSNIISFDVKYYLIDAEILFSRSPFVKNEAETFSYVKPNTELTVPTNKQGEKTLVPLPESLNHRNVIIEVKSNELQRFVQHYSCDLNVQLQEQIGEMRVFQTSKKKALASVYVKVFVKTSDGKSVFFKDGFTDIRGKFEYAKASASSDMKTSQLKQFAIFVSHDQLGSLIKTADADKLKGDAQIVDLKI